MHLEQMASLQQNLTDLIDELSPKLDLVARLDRFDKFGRFGSSILAALPYSHLKVISGSE